MQCPFAVVGGWLTTAVPLQPVVTRCTLLSHGRLQGGSNIWYRVRLFSSRIRAARWRGSIDILRPRAQFFCWFYDGCNQRRVCRKHETLNWMGTATHMRGGKTGQFGITLSMRPQVSRLDLLEWVPHVCYGTHNVLRSLHRPRSRCPPIGEAGAKPRSLHLDL
jgi:hypothetical protein